jgi:DNA topoisomerase I
MKLVVVESPAKAKTINKYLGKDYKVLASYGHIRDLPSKNGSVDPDNDFEMLWEADAQSAKRISDIANALKDADTLILATDPDREGEAISWHIVEALKKRRALKKDLMIERVVFNAITKSAVTQAMAQPRQIDAELVDAYLARRALDYLVGFNLSPVLWRKLPGSRSAGRVQSVALRIVCDRENEIELFRPQEYWDVIARLRAPDGGDFEARLYSLDGSVLKKFTLGQKGDADKALAAVKTGGYSVTSLEAKPVRRNPPPPFITSTLQQEASRKLGYGAKRTMQAAQKLYEEGRITYMRTDGVNMAEEAYVSARDMIRSTYGARYLPENPRRYTSKAKNAQEAHEAIRPTDFDLRPEAYRGDDDQMRLYTLIWRRAVASQMEAAVFERTTIDLTAKDKRAVLRATGQVVVFDGYIKLYTEGRDAGEDDEDGEGRLPKMAEGQHADLLDANAFQHFTAPPPRYTEASLVKRLEELGIGRPSTYASTMSTLVDRGYVRADKKMLIPEDKGRLVTAFLGNFFARYVEYNFTAGLEEKLDVISDGKLNWKVFLRDFWTQFASDLEGTKDLRVTHVLDALNETLGAHVFPSTDAEGNPVAEPRRCPTCKLGELSMKLGKFGAFVGCSRHPECKFTRQFSSDGGEGFINPDGNALGMHPDTGEPIMLKSGRFGPYVEMPNGEKPKRASLGKADTPETLTLARAVELLSLPREIGKHPEDGEPILANFGRFGPYVQHGKTFANLKDPADVFAIGLNRAVAMIADKVARGASSRAGAAALKVLGEHPDGGALEVHAGKYGPYIKFGKVNATLPKELTPDTITLEAAIELVNARGGGTKKKAAPKKAASKTAASPKPAARKTAATKKVAAKKTGRPKEKI